MFLLMSFISLNVNDKSADALSKSQKSNADRIAKYTADHYDKYGVLPSIAVAQAMQESSLGKHCPNYNMWGLASGKIYCSSLENGCDKYLRVINNGYYKGAPFCKDWRTQIRRILAGGYCQPADEYYSCVISIVNKYNFTKYDKKMWKDRKAKKEAKKKLKEKKRKAKLAKKKAATKAKNQKIKNQRILAEQKAKAITPASVAPTSSINDIDEKDNDNNLILNNLEEDDDDLFEFIPLEFDIKNDIITFPETDDITELDIENRKFIEYEFFDFIKKDKIYFEKDK
jgi:hypothetical protein